MQKTIPAMFEESVSKFSDNPLLYEKINGEYKSSNYREIQLLIHKFAAGLISLGFSKGDRATLISEGRNNWVISEMGILYAGGVNVPVSVKINESNDLKFRILHSESKIVICSPGQLHKIRAIKNDLPELEKVIILDCVDIKDDDEICFDEVIQRGTEFLAKNVNIFSERWMNIKENDYANICYTSGTTADPKGIILTHRNYTANVEQATKLLPIPQGYTSLLILPWDHAFAHTAGIFTLMKNGASMASIETGSTPLDTLKNIPKNIKEIKPTFLLSVPALAKNFRKNIENGIRQKGEKIESLFNFALKISYEYNSLGFDRGKGLSKLKYPLIKLFDKILFSKIREGFGGRLEFFIGGGALLDIELQRFFYAIGIPMYQGYGLTEAAPIISANVPAIHKLGSSGRIVADLEVKICDESGNAVPAGQKGEIICRGENVMAGYWKNPKATEETIKNGWLYTGDLGYMDEDGFLYVLGRNKSLLIASDGEKYSPEGIEEAITDNSNLIEQIMLHNNQNQYTVALIYPNKEILLSKLNEQKLNIKSEEGVKFAIGLINDEINKYKRGGVFENEFPERWIPSSFAILGEGFTEQNKFLNSTLKMVRPKITEFYINRIAYMYTPEGQDVFNHQNINIVSRFSH